MEGILLYGLFTLGVILGSLAPYWSAMTPAEALRHLRKDEALKRSVLESFLPLQICLALAFTTDAMLFFQFGGDEGNLLFALHLLTLPLLVLPMAIASGLPGYVVVRHWRDQRDAKEARARARAAKK